jgi:DNA-binding CsgD family transcriptional regulator
MERIEIPWTPRQREVLGLLARGHTNPDIARELGISLDGAKWHVSEVMSILGVSSREAAAAYWRRENRLPARFVRTVRGLVAVPALRWTAAAGGGLAVVSVLVVLLLTTRGGDEAGQTIPDSTETPAPTTPTPGQTPTTPTVPASVTPGPIGQLNGQPVYELVPAPERELPTGSVLYSTITCGVCVGGELYRFAQDGTGAWVREKLSPDSMPGIDGGYPYGNFVTDGSGRFAVLWCIPEGGRGCGKTHDGTADTRHRAVMLSDDGGVSWRQLPELPAGSSVIRFIGSEVLVAYSKDPASGETAYRLYPSGTDFDVSTLPQYDTGIQLPGGLLRVQQEDAAHPLANEGSSVFSFLPTGSGAAELVAFPGGSLWLGVPVADTLAAASSVGRNPKAMLLDPPRELGGFPRTAVLVDLEQRTVSPIAGLAGNDPYDIFDPEAFLPGPVLRVSGAGDCLNLREAHSTTAPVLKCFVDNVLFVDSGERSEAGGQTWARVTAPGKLQGWAALDYLQPMGAR